MEYLLLFLEGIITFISPCILPMIPIYLSYFSGGNTGEENNKYRTVQNIAGFVLGFTIVFTLIGALAGTIGTLIIAHQKLINVICGTIITVFGLNYMGIFKLNYLAKSYRINYEIKSMHFISSLLFGMVFSIGWTPCVGTFLGSALMIALSSGNTGKGILMLLIYSMGLGVPFMLCGIFIDSLKGTFTFFKQHYKLINRISGGILVIIGISMMTGMFYKITSILTI